MKEEVKFKEERKGRVMLWMGKPINSYSKEELIEIVYHLSNNIRRQQERHIEQLEELIG